MEKNALISMKETPSSEKSSLLENTSTITRVNVVKAVHIWRISNFGFLCQHPFPSLFSEVFGALDDNKIKWILRLNVKSNDNSVVMQLLLLNYQSEVRAKYKLIIYDGTMNEAKVISKSHFFTEKQCSISETMCCQDYITSADNKILSNDELTVGCEVQFVKNFRQVIQEDCFPKFRYSDWRLNNLELMFKNHELSDVKINIGNHTFNAHKAILAAASPVFLAMFKSSMTETEQNSIDIDDIDEETFEEMLRFIYTGNVNDIENVAYKLFSVADKYAIDTLKQICERQLCKGLTVENAVSILILAELHNADWLKARVINFIKLHPIAVTKTKDFKSMTDSHGHLLADIIHTLAIE